jgi:hypothetical protein
VLLHAFNSHSPSTSPSLFEYLSPYSHFNFILTRKVLHGTQSDYGDPFVSIYKVWSTALGETARFLTEKGMALELRSYLHGHETQPSLPFQKLPLTLQVLTIGMQPEHDQDCGSS